MGEGDTHKGMGLLSRSDSFLEAGQLEGVVIYNENPWLTSVGDSEHRKTEIDGHKDDSLKKQKDGNAHWKKELASDSEHAVRTSFCNCPVPLHQLRGG